MRSAYLKMHAAIFLWGFTGLLGKFISLNEGLLVWYRLLISAVVLFVWLLYQKKLPRLSFRQWIHLSGIGMLVMLHWVAFYGSIKYSNISVAMVCLSSIAMFASILEPLINRQRFDYLEVVFSFLALLGIGSIYFSDVTASTGIILGVVCALFSALFSIFNRRIASQHDPLTISLVELSAGWLGLTFLLPLYLHRFPVESIIPGAHDWILLLVLSLFCTVLTWILSLQALQKVSAFTMALALNLEPIYGILLAVLFAGEGKVITPWFLAGAALILATVVAHTVYRFQKARKLRAA